MATLVSPGVSVSVIDESISTGAGEGTVPFILLSTAQDKTTPDATGIASGTTKANAGKLYLMTSQRELLQTFGDPIFAEVGGNAINGSPLSEYGLLAAHSYLGLANRAYVARADIDLAEIQPSVLEPTSTLPVGTMWVDSELTQFGLQVVTAMDGTTPTWTPAEVTHVAVGATLPDAATTVVGDYGVLFADDGNISYHVVEGSVQAEADAIVADGIVDSVVMTDVGSGYESVPAVFIPFPDGTTATSDSVVLNGEINAYVMTSVGGGYTAVPAVTVGAPDGTTATADADISPVTANVVAYNVIDGGGGYTVQPNVTVSAPDSQDATIGGYSGAVDGSGAVAVTFGGAAFNDTNPPVVVQISGTGTGANFTATVNAGIVTDIQGDGLGGGYVGDEVFTIQAAPSVQAEASVNLVNGVVDSMNLDVQGEGYTVVTVTIDAPVMTQAVGTAVVVNSAVTGILLTDVGAGYASNPIVTLEDPVLTLATATATLGGLEGDEVVSIAVDDAGAGYATPPVITIEAPTALSNWTLLSATANDFQFASVEPSTKSDGISALQVSDWYVRSVPSASGAQFVVSVLSGETGQYVYQPAPMLADDTAAEAWYGVDLSTGDIYIQEQADASVVMRSYNGTIWADVLGTDYEVSPVMPTQGPSDGALWYNPDVGTNGQGNTTVDMLINNGTGSWEALNMPGYPSAGPTLYLQSTNPKATGATLVDGDVWVDTDQLNDYPVISRWKMSESRWVRADNSDQTSNAGVVFADARPEPDYVANATNVGDYNGGGASMDIDVPDPAAYPKGMLLWNTRYSTRNVKSWNSEQIVGETAMGDPYFEGRWTNASGNDADGSPRMGSDAQRAVIVEALQSVLVNNTDVRSEFIFFNLIATPGFPECIDEMIALNVDRKETGFIVADTPFTLQSTATELQEYTTNAANAAGNGQDAILSADPYLGVYYPSGLSTNIDGSDVVVPPSHMMLRTMAYNDQVAYPWFAPAGLTRGRITNAGAVGYVDDEGEFQPVTLNQGQRDTLYTNNVNPLAFIPSEGLVAFGQKTRNPFDSALSRINVARLINYIRYQSEKLARPFLFEPNDSQTRDNVKDAYDRFLAELITLRGLSDFLVVCDESNNTPARIDRNELWIDIAIVPTKAIEFIYIPIRIRNTGADLSASTGN